MKSFGGHTTIHVAAFNTEDTKLNVRGMVLLAAVGHRMPDSVWPISSSVLGMVIPSNLPVVSPMGKYMTRLVHTNLLRFPNIVPTNHNASGKLSEKCHLGPRFAFDRGGRNIQKNKADVLAVEILR
uniref:Uncharacterized protein n=1 Tax=Globisporangium ultimum (strain ATCC 200006 / CBS 805.95 / DAOM BR144) TaxID=431595 RepID=K3X745_GLOUD